MHLIFLRSFFPFTSHFLNNLSLLKASIFSVSASDSEVKKHLLFFFRLTSHIHFFLKISSISSVESCLCIFFVWLLRFIYLFGCCRKLNRQVRTVESENDHVYCMCSITLSNKHGIGCPVQCVTQKIFSFFFSSLKMMIMML